MARYASARLQPRRFVTIKMRIVSREQNGLKSVRRLEYATRDPLAFHCEELAQPTYAARDLPVDHLVVGRGLGIALDRRKESVKEVEGILTLVRQLGLKRAPCGFNGLRQAIVVIRR